MGNPHAVVRVDDVDTAPVETLGPLIERHARFPNRVNAGFMQIVDKKTIRLRVFERGVGETLAGRLLVWDALATRFRTVKLPRDPDCALCGPRATIRDLSAHADATAPVCAL